MAPNLWENQGRPRESAENSQMRIIDKLRLHVRRLLSQPAQELGRWGRLALYQMRLWRHCRLKLRQNNARAMSAALAFHTIFALIPVLVLALLAVKAAGTLGDYKQSLAKSLDAAGLRNISLAPRRPASAPASRPGSLPAGGAKPTAATQPARADSVADWIERLADRVQQKLTFGRAGPIGVGLLVWSAVMMLVTIERSLNRIFGAPRSRSMARRLALYWSVLTLGPLLLSATVYSADFAAEAMKGLPVLSWLVAAAGWVAPVIVGVALLGALYTLVPNTKVHFAAALAGAFVAVMLWLMAKWAFMLYVTQLAGSVYGALGLLPLFLIWINISWWLFLFGAQLAHTAANLDRLQAAERTEKLILTAWDMLAAGLAVGRHYLDGHGPMQLGDVADRLRLTEAATGTLLEQLAAAGALAPAGPAHERAYVPARPLEKIRVLDLLGMGPELPAPASAETAEPLAPSLPPHRHDPATQAVLDRVRDRTDAALKDLTLADVLEGKSAR